jgi:membrane protein implicated in regulation of membrane protease activity
MNFDLSPAAIWFIIGFVLLILEFSLPGLIIFFFGIGAWIVAFACLFADLTFNNQLILFILSSLLSVLLLRKSLKKMLMARKLPGALLEDEFIGKIAKAETAISPGHNGKVTFKGASWQASSSEAIAAGENVIITGNESIVLIVKRSEHQ